MSVSYKETDDLKEKEIQEEKEEEERAKKDQEEERVEGGGVKHEEERGKVIGHTNTDPYGQFRLMENNQDTFFKSLLSLQLSSILKIHILVDKTKN